VRAGASDRVTFQQIAAESIPHRDRFDLVMAFNCIHAMAHPPRAQARRGPTMVRSGCLRP